ncbi:MAG: monooxygenase [Burkholderiales bacterium RIFCSPHIGHO2_12_FULL_69_20]|nr:MAG: monooxygenase [Burkholderiales bacterium RIFCSPHIGHO2_12_FULL_69_20]
MHQPADQPRPSLYYRYQVFDSAPPPADPGIVPALVVGAGPIGLTTALGLAQQGVRCVVLEAERQVSEGSRAIVFTRRSMEILQQAGAAHAVQRMGLPWRHGNSYYRGQPVFRMEAPHSDDERYAPMTNLQQQYLEEFLLDAVARQPLIELRWGHQVSALHRHDEQGVELEIDTPQGPYTQAALWVVAADGARSTLRSLCGLKLEGAAYEGRFVIADIRIDLPLPTERLAFFDPGWNPGNTVLMHREPHGIWRIDYQLPPGETPEQALQPASMKARIDAQLAAIGHAGLPWQMDWSSVYSARALTLPDYVHQRIAFVGDAAHLLPIFGVRGANTGLQDAQNLAWKLGLVLRGLAGPALLPSYSAERVAAAREIIDEAGKSTRFMTPPTRGFRLLRDAVLSLSLTQAFVRPLYHWRTSRPHAYGHSALNAPDDDSALFTAGPAPGAPLPNGRLGDDAYLLDALCGEAAGHFTLLIQGDPPDAGVLACVQRWQQRGVPLPVIQLAAHGVPPALGVRRVLADADGRLQQRLGLPAAGGAYLLRPDQHVCGRWHALSADQLDRALHQALGQP